MNISMSFKVNAINQYKLDTIEEYYEYMGQCNMFKPKLDKLAPETRAQWEREYAEAVEAAKE